MNKNITIVLPVYGDWDSLNECIHSLIKQVDKRHTIILANDRGPEYKEIEENILKAVDGQKNFKYFLNERNLGFVENCNNAVFNLDKTDNDILLLNTDTEVVGDAIEEMIDVLYSHERVGTVTPRSNNATIFSIPIHNHLNHTEITPERSYELYENLKRYLPRTANMPTGMGFCLLIRRSLIENFGLFDTKYSPGYQEENDFCQRINDYGYSSVVANHAFVKHYESRSFSSEKKIAQNKKNTKFLLETHKHFLNSVQRYVHVDVDAVEYFAPIIGKLYDKKRILIDLYYMPSAFNGTAKVMLYTLKTFAELNDPSIEVTVLANNEAKKFHNLDQFGLEILSPDDFVIDYEQALFDISVTPGQIFLHDHLRLVTKIALKNIVCLFDIIGVRSNYLLNTDHSKKQIFLDTITYSDRIITISDYSRDDALHFYDDFWTEDEQTDIRKKFETVYLGRDDSLIDVQVDDSAENKIRFDDYILVMGNDYKHKSIEPFIESIANDKKNNYVILGPKRLIEKKDNIQVLKSGFLSDQQIYQAYKNAKLVIFPSQYEGFGIPIFDALSFNNNIIVHDNQLNREIITNMIPEFKEHIFTYSLFSEFEVLIEKALASKSPSKVPSQKNSDIGYKLNEIVMDELNREVDIDKLRKKWRYLKSFDRYMYRGDRKDTSIIHKMFFRLKGLVVEKTKENKNLYVKIRRLYQPLKRIVE